MVKKIFILGLVLLIGAIIWEVVRLSQGSYYYLQPSGSSLFGSVEKPFLYDGELMKVLLEPLMERVVPNSRKLLQDPAHEASGMIMVWIPESANAEVRVKELSLKAGGQDQPFRTGLCRWDKWNGESFKSDFDWKTRVLKFPEDGLPRGTYKVAYIGMNQIKLRQSKDEEFEFRLVIEAASGDKKEVFAESYKMTKIKARLDFMARMFLGAK